jgi:Flp pilus assembly protein TadB
MNNPKTQTTLVTRHRMETSKRTIKNGQSKDTDNIGHKTQTTMVTRHRQHWSQLSFCLASFCVLCALLSVSLDYSFLIVLSFFSIVYLFCVLWPMLSVSLDCPFLIVLLLVFILCLVTNVVCVFGLFIFDCPFVFL